MKSRWFRRALMVVALIVVGWVVATRLLRTDPVDVTIFRVARGLVEESITNSKAGTVKTRRRASLSAEIGGRVAELPIREGDRVRAGQVILRLASDDYRARVELRRRSVEAAAAAKREACTAAEQAGRDLARYVRLAEQGIASEEVVEQVRNRRDTADSSCEGAVAREREAAAATALSEVDLSKTVLRAPFDGIVAEVRTEVGEWITPSPPGLMIPPVIEILGYDAIYISAPLDEVDVGKAATGLDTRITMDAFPGRSFSGAVVRVAPYVDDVEEQNRTFEIEVEFEDAEFSRTLPPGTSADVEVILDARDDVLRVPSYSLVEGNSVLVLEQGFLRSREVRTGLRNWEFTEILDGLDAGEQVVVSLDRAEVQDGASARASAETPK